MVAYQIAGLVERTSTGPAHSEAGRPRGTHVLGVDLDEVHVGTEATREGLRYCRRCTRRGTTTTDVATAAADAAVLTASNAPS